MIFDCTCCGDNGVGTEPLTPQKLIVTFPPLYFCNKKYPFKSTPLAQFCQNIKVKKDKKKELVT
jgi:hypothetical protein